MPARRRARTSRASSARRSPGPAGRARRPGPSPSARTPRSGPRRSPCPSSGSGWEVKNWNGVDAAHSSPMNSIGVNGPAQGQQRRAGQLVVVEVLGEPVAARRGCRSGRGSGCRRRAARSAACSVSIGHAVVAPRNDDQVPSWKKPALAHLRQRRQRLEVGVVAGGLAGQRDVHGVVEVVAPLRVEPVAAGLARRDQPRVVEVGLGDQRQRPAAGGPTAPRPRSPAPRGGARSRVVGERVHGVEPQPVDVVVRAATSATLSRM